MILRLKSAAINTQRISHDEKNQTSTEGSLCNAVSQ